MIVFPMAGASRRFLESGYDVPKFMLPIWQKTVFDYAVSSFSEDFATEPFLFIYRETGGIRNFIEQRSAALGITQPIYAEVERVTQGQAETVEYGLDISNTRAETQLTVFNIDTFRSPVANPVRLRKDTVGWLEVFRGEGENWSFIEPDGDTGLVKRTAEKIQISDFCSTGLYNFARTDYFRVALDDERKNPSSTELYIAPIYNHLIARHEKVGYGVVERANIIFCGVPLEYEELKKRFCADSPFQSNSVKGD